MKSAMPVVGNCHSFSRSFLSISTFRDAVLVACITCLAGCQRAKQAADVPAAHPPRNFITEADDGPLSRNGSPVTTDFLERHSVLLAGPGGIDCGRVGRMADPAPATKCALRANAKGKPFRIRYNLMGADSVVALAMVRTPQGRVSVLFYDSDPSGGGSELHGLIYPTPCPEPVQLWVNQKGRIDCLHGPKDPMS